VLPLLFGATVGYLGVRGQPEIVKQTLLAFTANVLTTVVVEEIVPEAHEDGEARFAALVFVGGFAAFTLLSAYSVDPATAAPGRSRAGPDRACPLRSRT
jgi:ZIP family zinc transporter